MKAGQATQESEIGSKYSPDSRFHTVNPKVAKIRFSIAGEQERGIIYCLRHETYARELGQHNENAEGRLTDSLDRINTYLVASEGDVIVGFVSITPPSAGTYSIDKYFSRTELPFAVDKKLFEIRLLTVIKERRGRQLAAALMYAAFRWVEAHGGSRIVAIGRREILDLYLKAGLQKTGLSTQSGKVVYDLLHVGIGELREWLERFGPTIERLEEQIDWQLGISFRQPAACFHGGAFFKGIGEKFDALEKKDRIINADVLDAWFPPSPKVMEVLQEHLDWFVRTSPPTGCEGLIQTIAETRGVNPESILPGAGSSDLIFLTLQRWLRPSSRVLILDPAYGEYAHLFEKVIRCQVDRLTLFREKNYEVDLARLKSKFAGAYDLVVLVNPNSPTGQHIPRAKLESLLQGVTPRTMVWVDETYVEYAGAGQSLESFAIQTENVVVCKSMSKVYALSGVRAAYLCAAPHLLEELQSITPPWAISLPGQIAAVRALQDPQYYLERYEQTHALRKGLMQGLKQLGLDVIPGIANFLLCHLPVDGVDAGTIVRRCQEKNLYLRDASLMGTSLGRHALRIAVKSGDLNCRMLKILEDVLKNQSK